MKRDFSSRGCLSKKKEEGEATHDGADVGIAVLLPATVDQVSIPVIASGGMADGAALCAAAAVGMRIVNASRRSPICTFMVLRVVSVMRRAPSWARG